MWTKGQYNNFAIWNTAPKRDRMPLINPCPGFLFNTAQFNHIDTCTCSCSTYPLRTGPHNVCGFAFQGVCVTVDAFQGDQWAHNYFLQSENFGFSLIFLLKSVNSSSFSLMWQCQSYKIKICWFRYNKYRLYCKAGAGAGVKFYKII